MLHSRGTIVITAGTLISHEKLLLQINTERELGNMDYKLGQVGNEAPQNVNGCFKSLNLVFSQPPDLLVGIKGSFNYFRSLK